MEGQLKNQFDFHLELRYVQQKCQNWLVSFAGQAIAKLLETVKCPLRHFDISDNALGNLPRPSNTTVDDGIDEEIQYV